MAILTYKEYSELKDVQDKIAEKGSGLAPLPTSVIKHKRIEYRLFHPDNSSSGYINKKYFVKVGEEKFELDIKNGVITTDKEEVKTILIQQGFILMYEKEVSDA